MIHFPFRSSLGFFWLMTTTSLSICLYSFRAVQETITVSWFIRVHCMLCVVEISKLCGWDMWCLKYFLCFMLLMWVCVQSFISNCRLSRKNYARFTLFIRMLIETYAKVSTDSVVSLWPEFFTYCLKVLGGLFGGLLLFLGCLFNLL